MCVQQRFLDQPVHLCSLIRIVTWRIWIAKGAKFLHADNEDWSDCADALAYLNSHWTHMSEGTFSHVVAQFNMYKLWVAAVSHNLAHVSDQLTNYPVNPLWTEWTLPHYILESFNFVFKYVRLCDLDIPGENWSNYLQTMETQIRCRVLWRLTWVCTVCQ